MVYNISSFVRVFVFLPFHILYVNGVYKISVSCPAGDCQYNLLYYGVFSCLFSLFLSLTFIRYRLFESGKAMKGRAAPGAAATGSLL